MTDLLQPDPPVTGSLNPAPAATINAPATAPDRRRIMAGRYGAAMLAAASLTLLGAIAADVVNVTFTAGGVSRTVFEQRGYETVDGQVLAGLAGFSLALAVFGWYR